MLQGKTICDISINNNKDVSEYVQTYTDKDLEKDSQCMIEFISEGDSYRIRNLNTLGFNCMNKLLNLDLNMVSTTSRALKMNATKQLKILLEYVLEFYQSVEYNDIIMLDLEEIMKSNSLDISKYFQKN